MKIAIIDMGTNTFHLLIAKVENQDYTVLQKKRISVKIGEKGINEGFINSDAIGRAIKALKDFKFEIEKHSVKKIFATATSALRNAENGADLVKLIEKETGITTKIISGLQEADYIYNGVIEALDIGNNKCLIMDIGGGSIEFLIASQSKIFWKQSYEIGGQRMVELFHKSDPISTENITNLENYLDQALKELFQQCSIHQPNTLIGSSGTFETLSDIFRIKKNIEDNNATELPFDIMQFEDIFQDIVSKNRVERLQIPGMVELRVDMIVVAVAILRFILNKCHIKKLRVSAYALKEGVLLKVLDDLMNVESVQTNF